MMMEAQKSPNTLLSWMMAKVSLSHLGGADIDHLKITETLGISFDSSKK